MTTFYSQMSYTINADMVATPVFSYGNINLLDSANNDIGNLTHNDQLFVYLNSVLLSKLSEYTVNSNTEQITVSATLEVGDVLVIKRETKIDARYVDFTNGSNLDESTLDLDSLQLFHLIQEIYDQAVTGGMTLNLVDLCWDGQGYRTCNFSPATTNSGLTTLAQVQGLIAGAEIANVDNINYWEFTGNGSITSFSLTSAPQISEEKELWVWVDGVIQDPITSYTVDTSGATPAIVFSTAPLNGANIRVRSIVGTVTAVLATDALNGSGIIDGTVNLSALNVFAGLTNRFIVADDTGTLTVTQIDPTYLQNFESTVQGYRLDQFAAPTANVSFNNNKITNLAVGTVSSDAVNKGQMDAAISTAVAGVESNIALGNPTARTSVSLPFTETNNTSKPKMYVVYGDVTATGGIFGSPKSVVVSFKSSSSSFVTVGSFNSVDVGDQNDYSVTVIVPAGGSIQVTGTNVTTTNVVDMPFI